MTIENPSRCSYAPAHGPACDKLGTHRVVLVLSNEAGTLFKKFLVANPDKTPQRRCPAHQAAGKNESGEFITTPAHWAWLSERYARTSLPVVGYVATASRGATTVQYASDEVEISEIPILVPALGAAGGLEQVGTARRIVS